MVAHAAEVHFGRLHACLRELTGADELLVQRDDTRTALGLLDAVLVPITGGWPAPGEAASLTTAERDRLLAELWIRTWGPSITGSPVCSQCATRFDMSFGLDELCAATWPEPPPVRITSEGRRYRVPTGADELAVTALPTERAVALLATRCALDEGSEADASTLAQAFEASVPVLDLDLDARCPGCGYPSAVAFRLQSYLLTALRAERARLPTQIHTLATAYGWSVREILELPRSTRIQLVGLAESQASPRRAS